MPRWEDWNKTAAILGAIEAEASVIADEADKVRDFAAMLTVIPAFETAAEARIELAEKRLAGALDTLRAAKARFVRTEEEV